MFTMNIARSEDRMEVSLTFPGMPEPLKMDAPLLDDLIRQLAWIRTSMLPAREPVDPTPDTQFSAVPATRWAASEDVVPGQTRLSLLHPGFGWIWIPLDRASFDDMSQKLRLFLREPTRKQ